MSTDVRSHDLSSTALAAVMAAEAEAQAVLATADSTVAELRGELTRELEAIEVAAQQREADALGTLASEVRAQVRTTVDAEVTNANTEVRSLRARSDEEIGMIADRLAYDLLAELRHSAAAIRDGS